MKTSSGRCVRKPYGPSTPLVEPGRIGGNQTRLAAVLLDVSTPNTLNADFDLMRSVAGITDARNEEIRAMLQAFIGRMSGVPPSVWGGLAAARFQDVVDPLERRVDAALPRPARDRRHHPPQRGRAAGSRPNPCPPHRRRRRRPIDRGSASTMNADPVLSYNFDAIEYSVRQEIHTTAARFNAALQELRSQIAPLQQLWTREAAAAYHAEQLKWHQAASALNEILIDLGNAVRHGADDVAHADRRAAGAWAR